MKKKLMPSKQPHQELIDVHRRVHGDLPAKVVFKLVLAAAGRGGVAEELGEALREGWKFWICFFFFRRQRQRDDSMVVSFCFLLSSLSLSLSSQRRSFEPDVAPEESFDTHLDAHGGRKRGGGGKRKGKERKRRRDFFRFRRSPLEKEKKCETKRELDGA